MDDVPVGGGMGGLIGSAYVALSEKIQGKMVFAVLISGFATGIVAEIAQRHYFPDLSRWVGFAVGFLTGICCLIIIPAWQNAVKMLSSVLFKKMQDKFINNPPKDGKE